MEHKWVDRRDFLFMGSAAAVGIAATSLSAESFDAIKRIDGANPILSIGFAAADADSRVVAANSLRSGDPSLSNTVRVTVHGLWRADSQAAPQAVHVSTFFNTGAEPVPFIAWSSTVSTPPRVSFTMDRAGRQPLLLGIERERIISQRLRRSRFGRALSDDSLPNAAVLERAGGLCALGGEKLNLQRGTYFFALRQSMWDHAPNWSSISIDAEQLRAGGDTVLHRAGHGVGFDYVAVSVDTA